MAETWVLNAMVTLPSSKLSGVFTSNGHSYLGIEGDAPQLYYLTGSSPKSVFNMIAGWSHDAYRTLVFDTAPTGAMLTWLQANGVKQGGSDPEPETPTNACLIDGTVYGIKTGRTLVNGTARTIYNGKALVDGTGYNIVVGLKSVAITITNQLTISASAYVQFEGQQYTSGTIDVPAGEGVTICAASASTCYLMVNDVLVTYAKELNYAYTPPDGVKSVTIRIENSNRQIWFYVDES
nr:MAG TPA: hypothetical protein [Bacteriophage sp.]